MRLLALTLFLICASLKAADDRIKVDNEYVRVIKAVVLPHTKTPLHRHQLNRVMIYLDPAALAVTSETGQIEEQHWQAGQVAWSPITGLHTSENIGSAPARIIEIEIKKAAPASKPMRNPSLDPIAIDPQHNVLLFENDQVRVFRSWRESGAAEPMHEHVGAGRLIVLLTDVNARVKSGAGKSVPLQGSAGDVFWSGPIVHATTNIGSHELAMLVVEVN